MEHSICCPYCGEANIILIDESSGESQEYIEDCQVCCRPWILSVTIGPGGELDVTVRTGGEA